MIIDVCLCPKLSIFVIVRIWVDFLHFVGVSQLIEMQLLLDVLKIPYLAIFLWV